MRRDDRLAQISAARIRDYLSYLVELDLLRASEGKYLLNFSKPSTDQHWAQALSDSARQHLSGALDVPVAQLPRYLDKIRQDILKAMRVPTVAAIVSESGVEGTRREETFRWSLYVYADGDAAPLEIRQSPHLVPKTKEKGDV